MTPNENLNFVAIEDHPLMSDAIGGIVKKMYPEAHYSSFAFIEDFLTWIKKNRCDFLFFDLMLNGIISLSDVEFVRNKYPNTKILVLSSFAEELYAYRIMNMGIDGFMNKKEPLFNLEGAISTILSGGVYFKKSILAQVQKGNANSTETGENPFRLLGNREFEICILLVEGISVTEIASILNLSRSTVSNHKMKIMDKLKVKTLVQLRSLADSYHLTTN